MVFTIIPMYITLNIEEKKTLNLKDSPGVYRHIDIFLEVNKRIGNICYVYIVKRRTSK